MKLYPRQIEEIIMTWTCGICGREFKRTNQLHSCRSYDLEGSFSGSGERWIPFYQRILGMARQKLPPFTEYFQKVGVLWRGSSTFAEFRFTKREFFVFFFWDSLRVDSDPVKHFQMSTNRVAHQVVVNEDDLDQVLEWIADSYFLTQRDR
jgi:hypothetical protein